MLFKPSDDGEGKSGENAEPPKGYKCMHLFFLPFMFPVASVAPRRPARFGFIERGKLFQLLHNTAFRARLGEPWFIFILGPEVPAFRLARVAVDGAAENVLVHEFLRAG